MSTAGATSDATEPLSDAEYQTLAQFRHALRRFLHFSEDSARAAGITPAQHQLLLAIRGCPDGQPAPFAALAEMLQIRLHSVVELVDRAVGNGLVVRAVDPDDHRRALVSLTPVGNAHLEKLAVLHRDELRRFRREMTELLDEL